MLFLAPLGQPVVGLVAREGLEGAGQDHPADVEDDGTYGLGPPSLGPDPGQATDLVEPAVRADDGLAPRDAFHAAHALEAGCEAIVSSDRVA